MSDEAYSAGNQSNACRGKKRHTSKKIALGAIRVMTQKGAPFAHRLQAYRCRSCKHWHTGNSREAR